MKAYSSAPRLFSTSANHFRILPESCPHISQLLLQPSLPTMGDVVDGPNPNKGAMRDSSFEAELRRAVSEGELRRFRGAVESMCLEAHLRQVRVWF